MPNNRLSARVICPFYQSETKVTITCEGPFEDTAIMLRFLGQEKKDAYQQCVCCTFGYTKCKIAAMLMKTYEDME